MRETRPVRPSARSMASRLAATRLEQGQPRQAEQLALKSNALSGGDRRLQAQNWQLVARARWALDDSAGARAAEKKARDLFQQFLDRAQPVYRCRAMVKRARQRLELGSGGM